MVWSKYKSIVGGVYRVLRFNVWTEWWSASKMMTGSRFHLSSGEWTEGWNS